MSACTTIANTTSIGQPARDPSDLLFVLFCADPFSCASHFIKALNPACSK